MTSQQHKDRRVQKTRSLIQQVFIDVVREKGFTKLNIKDITDRANLNRGTFYIHFTDKYDLLNTVLRDQFRSNVFAQLPPEDEWDSQTLRLIISAVLKNFEGKYHHQQRPPFFLDDIAPLIERGVMEELADILRAWLLRRSSDDGHLPVSSEVIVSTLGWAIFGTALQWSRGGVELSCEEMTDEIWQVVTKGILHLTPDRLSR